MRFLVLGAGALGGYFGGKLMQGGAEVDFLVRPRRAAELAERGLVIKEPDGDFTTKVKTLSAGEIDGPYDVVFFACKAFDLDSAIEAVAPGVGAGSAILPMLNGINHIDRLAERFGPATVLGGITVVRADLTPDGEIVRYAGTSDTAFGELAGKHSARCEAIREALAAGGIPSRVSDNMMAEMWTKFCGFAMSAAISTLTRAPAGEIAAAPAAAGFVASVFDECARAVTAEGYPPPAVLRGLLVSLFSPSGPLGPLYRPSIAVDLGEGRPTEGEHTIGDLVRRAERRGVEVPILRAALCNLQVAEARRQRPHAAPP